MLEVCSGVTNEKEKDGGYKRSGRTLVRGTEKRRELRYVLCVRACTRGLNLVILLLCISELDRSKSTYLLEESASPFIDEGDGLTSERERVRMSLSLVAHTSGYEMMVGAHNTVECQMHVGGCVFFFWYGRCRYLLYY